MVEREHKVEAIKLIAQLLSEHKYMLEHPREWSMNDGKKNRYYALRGKIEKSLAEGLEAEAERESLRKMLTSDEWCSEYSEEVG